MAKETVFSTDATAVAFGPGATREVGLRLKALGCQHVLLITDPRLAKLPPVETASQSLRDAGISFDLYDKVRVEPTDISWQDAIGVAQAGNYDGYVSVGGGSTIDTAKVANLYATHPAEFMAYVYPPLGEGRAVPGPLKPHIAIPTTAGTGSETTGNAVFDLSKMHLKLAIANRVLRPTIGLVDPDNTRSMPANVAASSGLDVLCHALESYTAVPYNEREAPEDPTKRTVYQGANPLSDIWSAKAIELCAKYLGRAVSDPEDDEARSGMLFASTVAGIGFGNAGVHLPHAMSYPISGLARDFIPDGYPDDHPIVPHGMSVILTAPAVFRWEAQANPQRHLEAAKLMGVDTRGAGPDDAGNVLADALIAIIKLVEMPNGLNAVGISDADMDTLVQGTLPQTRITQLSPRPATPDDYREIFSNSMRIW